MKINLIKNILLSIAVVLIAVLFISKKENLDIDELYTYGLANNSFQLDINNYKNYTGNELLLKYTAVSENNRFDVKKVFFNQEMDTHPPLYFMLVNFICSLKYGTFSMWYGLIINIIFLIILFFKMKYLLNKIINDELYSTIFCLLSFLLYGFVHNYTFTRMYVMLSAISLSFAVFIIDYIEKMSTSNSSINKNDFIFFIKFYLLCLVGILTQYHFVLVASFFSVILAYYLFKFKYFKKLLLIVLSGILSIITSISIFPPILKHVFGNGNNTHSLTYFENAEPFIKKLSTLSYGIFRAFFGNGIYIYLIFILIAFLICIIKKKIKFDILKYVKSYKLYFICLLCTIFYFLIICITVKLAFHRYLFNIYPFIFIIIVTPLYYIYKKLNKYLLFITAVVMLVVGIMSIRNNYPTSLNVEDKPLLEYFDKNKDVKTLMLYRTVDQSLNRNTMGTSLWKLPTPLYVIRNMENVSFVDISNEDAIANFSNESIEGFDDIFVIIYTNENDERLLNYIMQKNNVSSYNPVYFSTYFHIYRLI